MESCDTYSICGVFSVYLFQMIYNDYKRVSSHTIIISGIDQMKMADNSWSLGSVREKGKLVAV